MCQNIDKQQNRSLGFITHFKTILYFSLGKKKTKQKTTFGFTYMQDSGGLQSAVKGLSRNFSSEERINLGCARPQEAQCTLGRRPQAAAFSLSARLLPAAGQEGLGFTRSLVPGVSAPRKAFEGPGPTESSRGAGSSWAAAPNSAREGGRAAGPGAPGFSAGRGRVPPSSSRPPAPPA